MGNCLSCRQTPVSESLTLGEVTRREQTPGSAPTIEQTPASGSVPTLEEVPNKEQTPAATLVDVTNREQTSVSAPTLEEVINNLKDVSCTSTTDLKIFVHLIKQLLEEKSGKGSTSQSSMENKGMWTSFVKSGANFMKFVNDHTEKLEDKNDILSSGKSKVVAEILSKIGELHWVVGGLSMAAYLIEKCEKVSDNKAEALELLTKMVDLAATVIELKDVIPEEEKKLNKAVMMIVQGSIMCVSQINSENIFSFLKTSVNSEELKNMSETLHYLYSDLNLAIQKAIAKREPILLSVPKPFYPKDAVGIKNAQEKVIKLLNPEDESALVVVIYGFGGIGKTTLANAVVATLNLTAYNYATIQFDENQIKNDLKQMQELLLKDAFPAFRSGTTIKFRDCREGRQRLKEAFGCAGNKSVFLFIDNALRSEDLKELLPEDLSDLPKRSRILITTRRLDSTDVINGVTRHSFAVKTLGEDHAVEILCKDLNKREHIKDNMQRILRICGGVPLALTIVRGHLVKMGYDAYKCRQILDALERGSHVKEENLSRRVVDFVYNELEEGTKDSFLDICCFFNGWMRRHVEYIVGEEEVRSLEEAALVTPLVDDDQPLVTPSVTPFLTYKDLREIYAGEERLIVHDIVMAKGRSMSQFIRFMDEESFSQAPQDEKLQQTKGIWLTDERSLEAKSMDFMSKYLRVLSLGDRTKLNGRCERAFEQLRFLDICYEHTSSIQLGKSRQLASFHAHFMKEQRISNAKLAMNLPESLRLLYLDAPRDSPVSLDINAQLTSLRELQLINIAFENFETNIRSGNFPCLKILKLHGFKLEKLPDSIGNLASLQILSMDYCSKLKRFPNSFGNLYSLQALHVILCSSLETLPESFGNLSSLKTLRMNLCSNLKRLPERFGNLSSLQTLSIDYCSKLEGLPESFGNLFSLQTLCMNSCSKLERLPHSFGNLISLQTLRMNYCSKFKLVTLPESFGNLSALRKLRMDGCSMLEGLPENFGNLYSLQTLRIKLCSQLERLPESLANLSSLQTLCMNGCSKFEGLPESFGNLAALQTLQMDGCMNLEGLPESFGDLSSLRMLHMHGCSKLKGLPDSFGNLFSLQTLQMDGCSNLEGLPESFGNLFSLQTLRMNLCSKLEELPASFGKLSSLQTLSMDHCSKLEGLGESFGNLSSLQTLNIDHCSQLERLPDGFGNLSSLKKLSMDFCSQLKELSESFGNVASLQILSMDYCSKLERLPKNFGNIYSLQTLNMYYCSNLVGLPESFENHSSLQTLGMSLCSKLKGLPQSFGNLSVLQRLTMENCSNLEGLPETFGNLYSLETLSMDYCSKLEELPEGFGDLSSLQTLSMDYCFKLERLPKSFGNLSSLQTLRMNVCSKLQGLPESFGNLSSLNTLSMENCYKLEGLPESFGNLCSLKTLSVEVCSNLKGLPESFGNLYSLETLTIDYCSKLEELPESFGSLCSLKTLSMDFCSNLKAFPDSFGDLSSLQTLSMDDCLNLKELPESFGNLPNLQTLSMKRCANLKSLPKSFENLSANIERKGCYKIIRTM